MKEKSRVALSLLLLCAIVGGCDMDERKLPLRADAAVPDTRVAPEDGRVDGGSKPLRWFDDAGVHFAFDIGAPAVCDKEPECETDDDCGPTESCIAGTRIWDICAARCKPNPLKGGDCSEAEILPNPNPKNGPACIPILPCSSTDWSNCPPGTMCAPAYTDLEGMNNCTIPGPLPIHADCKTFTLNELETNCQLPMWCEAGTRNGWCRIGCDTYPGGEGKFPCPPPLACENMNVLLGHDYYLCCEPGSNCLE